MRKKKVLLSLLLALGLALTGCGGSNKMTEMATDSAAAAAEPAAVSGGGYLSDDIYSYSAQENGYAATEAEVSEDAIEEELEGSQSPEVTDYSRKLIKNVDLQVETEEFDTLLATVQQKTELLSGYIEESYTYNGSAYYGKGTRNANLTIRIPANKLNDFLSEIAEVSNVISRNESVTDVTLQYVDMESHKKALVTEQSRLLELLEQAENIEDVISIESRLSEVRYQIESMESQLRTMDNLVSYSTVYLAVEEVRQLTPVAEQSIGEKIAAGFQNSLTDIGTGVVNFSIGLIIHIPYILLWGAVIIILVLILRAVLKKRRSRKAQNLSEQDKWLKTQEQMKEGLSQEKDMKKNE